MVGVEAVGLLLAVAGSSSRSSRLLSDEQASPWRASRSTALTLGARSVPAIVAAFGVA